MADWYRRIKPPGSKADRVRHALKAPARSRDRAPLKKRNPKFIFYKTFSTSLYVNGVKIKVCSRFQIAKFFDVPVSTIVAWDRLGVLPEPFMEVERGRSQVPVFLAAQIRCLIRVVNDLTDEGYVSIRWSALGDHIDMLHAGYEQTLKNWRRRNRDSSNDEPKDRYGVSYLD